MKATTTIVIWSVILLLNTGLIVLMAFAHASPKDGWIYWFYVGNILWNLSFGTNAIVTVTWKK